MAQLKLNLILVLGVQPRDRAWHERKLVSFPRSIPQGNSLDPDPSVQRVTPWYASGEKLDWPTWKTSLDWAKPATIGALTG